MSKGEVHKQWREENLVKATINLNRSYDADIIQALNRAQENGEPKSSAAKRLMRQGIKAEKEGWV